MDRSAVELSRAWLVKAFSDDPSACLFATMGFWQGIDVPGRALSMVVIDKLPFARPDEPLLVARREKLGDAAFRLLDLPRAQRLYARGIREENLGVRIAAFRQLQ